MKAPAPGLLSQSVKPRLSTESTSVFPILVSLILLLLICVVTIIISRIEASLFSSVFDHLVINSMMYLLILTSIVWLLILLRDGFALHSGSTYPGLKWLLFFIYYPLGKTLHWMVKLVSRHPSLSRERFQNSFIAMQNRLLASVHSRLKVTNILLLLPHCLQFHECKIRITRDINDCADCGECDICHLKDLGKKYGIRIGIANGGTLARKLVKDTQPDYIIAVACHRDLTDGIRESWHYPVYAVLNERPYGPCHDTRVETETVEQVIKSLRNGH